MNGIGGRRRYVQLRSDFAETLDGEFHELSDHDVAEKVRNISAHSAHRCSATRSCARAPIAR